jgi:hypothetical protein
MTDQNGVGYGKPPKRTQFVKGKSGNLKGRPKGSKNFSTVIQEELEAPLRITENGKSKKITKRQAVAKQLVNRAAAGDPKAIPVLLHETRSYEAEANSGQTQSTPITQDDQMVMESIVRRIRESAFTSDAAAPSGSPPGDSADPAVAKPEDSP